VFYIRLTFVDKGAIVSRARDAVRVWEHASTDALASVNVDGNRILLLFLPIQGLKRGVQ